MGIKKIKIKNVKNVIILMEIVFLSVLKVLFKMNKDIFVRINKIKSNQTKR